ncbi:MAG: tetratricopeptide repeat protein [Acidobacteria bacterium]|nr:tetratricopeptide repeat protein [Acidobacteriota bacterium]
MKRFSVLATAVIIAVIFSLNTSAQDVRTATGLPIPIGESVIWGQVELKGLAPDETRPTIYVSLMMGGAQLNRVVANDKGYFVFRERARDGATLLVTVGGQDVGSVVITSAGGDRYDMTIDWNSLRSRRPPGVISVKDAYTGRSAENDKLFTRASEAAKAKKNSEAIKIFEQITKSDSKDFVAWTELGSLHFGNSKYSDAEKAYKKALELKPDFMPALMNLGKLYIADNKFAEAVPVLEKAVETDPASADANHYLGEAYLGSRQGSKAVGVLNEAIKLDPAGKAEVHLRLAALYNAANLKDRAAMEYRSFLEKKPDHPEKSKLEKYIKENLK